VDIKGIEADFLDSEVRLAKAMVDTVSSAGLTMLSYHCHKLIPKGVSCVGVLLESHISFHTWPGKFCVFSRLFSFSIENIRKINKSSSSIVSIFIFIHFISVGIHSQLKPLTISCLVFPFVLFSYTKFQMRA
jgi:hypothetical protein